MTDCEPDEKLGAVLAVIPQVISIADVAVIFGCSQRTIHRWIGRGTLDPVRIGRSIFIRVEDVQVLISGHMTDRILARR